MNTINKAFQKRGLSCREAAKVGLRYQTVWLHLHGLRNVGVKSALLYESVLGIPRSELRPDIWPPTESAPTTRPGGEEGNG